MNARICETEIACSKESALYRRYEKQSGSDHNRKCIDGKITGCGNCVGYCQFTGHPGFLTSQLRERQDCVGKRCRYYLEKPRRVKAPKQCDDTAQRLLTQAQRRVADMEGLRILKSAEAADGWVLSYITISNEYSLDGIAHELREELGVSVAFSKLNYDFDICVQLLLAA